MAAVLVYPLGVQVDSAATVTVRRPHVCSDIEFIEDLIACHDLVRRHSNGFVYHLFGARADLEAAIVKWNRRILHDRG